MTQSAMRKRRTREQIIADLGVNHIERQVLLCGHTLERPRSDYGIDLVVFPFQATGERENGDVRVQVKASETWKTIGQGKYVPCVVDRADVAHWIDERSIFILAVYDVTLDRAYWVDVQEYFGKIPAFNIFALGNTVTIRIPAENTLNPSAVDSIIARHRTLFGA